MLKYVSYLMCFFVSFGAAAYVDTLQKCSIKDQECLRNLYPTIIKDLAKKGSPEIGIPVLEPLALTDVTFPFLGLLNVTLTKGEATGVSGCTFDVFTVDFEKGSGHQENTCSVILVGQYDITASPIITSFIGEEGLHGNGNLKVIADQVHLSFDFPVHVQKRDDEKTYLKVGYEDIEYKMEIRGGLEIEADNIVLGGVETSKTIIPLINQNWKFFSRNFSDPVLKVVANIYFSIVRGFFENVSTDHYISDDLSSLAKP